MTGTKLKMTRFISACATVSVYSLLHPSISFTVLLMLPELCSFGFDPERTNTHTASQSSSSSTASS